MWFGGDVASIAGSCACPGGMALGKEDLRCKRPRAVGDTGNPGIWLVIGSLLGGIVLIGIVGLEMAGGLRSASSVPVGIFIDDKENQCCAATYLKSKVV